MQQANITLNAPVQLTLQPQTIATIMDLLALHLPYATAKPIIEQEIIPQLTPKPTEGFPLPEAEASPAP